MARERRPPGSYTQSYLNHAIGRPCQALRQDLGVPDHVVAVLESVVVPLGGRKILSCNPALPERHRFLR